MENLDDLRKRAIEYLTSQKQDNKLPNELNIKECSVLLGITEASTYAHMDGLVKKGEWKTRLAFDEKTHRNVRVWSLVE